MATVYCIGETVYDIIFQNGLPVAAKVGGSMLNTAVSLGRSMVPVEMITEPGQDRVGEIVLGFLKKNGVGTSVIRPSEGFRTPISLAFLDESGNAEYSFYRHYPPERLAIEWPLVSPGDVVLFGSYYSLDPAVHEKIARFISESRKSGAYIIYDPNFRKNHLHELKRLHSAIEENISLADLVRGSHEDFIHLFGLEDMEEVYRELTALGCMDLIYTRGVEGAWLLSGSLRLHAPAVKVRTVSTIGAGDGFNAGIIYGMLGKDLSIIGRHSTGYQEWVEILGQGADFASKVCSTFDNYIPEH